MLAVAATALVLAPSAPAQAGGSETALGRICEQVDGGTWNATRLTCATGAASGVSTPATQVCENAIGGQIVEFAVAPPLEFFWTCEVS
jgi:hypothetical protein